MVIAQAVSAQRTTMNIEPGRWFRDDRVQRAAASPMGPINVAEPNISRAPGDSG